MNKVLIPKITFKEAVVDEKKIEGLYAMLFEKARRNILTKRQLTDGVSQKYTEVQDGRQVSNNRGSSQTVTSQ